jgi:hypothetical protein
MGEIILGILIGAGAVAVGKKFYRPALKEGIKLGIVASEAAKVALHEGREQLTDIVAEARHEAEIERRARRIAQEEANVHAADQESGIP